jgi:hypothetical protein
MCELLIRVRDKVNDDPYLDARCFKRGDVVVVVDDDWQWGREELRNPDWRIVRLPNVSTAQAAAFLGEEMDEDPQQPSRALRRRGWSFDLAAASLPAAFRAWLADDSRASPARQINLTAQQLLALRRAKQRLRDPSVIG